MTEKLILYHGTSVIHLDAIWQSGLQPRRVTKQRSNWKGMLRSKPGFVYLTDAYPVYYALNPALRSKAKEADIVVLKVEVEESRLYPDEDFIAWEIARGDNGFAVAEDVRQIIASVDPAKYQEHWRASLESNGVVCTPSVPPEDIVDSKAIEFKNLSLLMALGGDSAPIPINYRFMGDHYRRCLEALFEEGEAAAMDAARSYWSVPQTS